MKNSFSTLVGASTLALGMALTTMAGSAQAFVVNFGPESTSSNSPATGASASVDFSFTQSGTDVLLELDITNTTGLIPSFGDGATSSKLTGIAFDLVAGTSYVDGTFIGSSYLDTIIQNADAQPFGTLDIGIADNNNFNGGNANDALPEGVSTTVSFLIGQNLNASVVESAFFTGFSSGDLGLVARFQQVNGTNIQGGSDKLSGGEVVPEPLTILGAGAAISFGTAFKRKLGKGNKNDKKA